MKNSTTLTLASGDTSQLAIGGAFNGSNTLIPGSAKITAIPDATHITLSVPTTGATAAKTTAATTVVYGTDHFQFPQGDLAISPGGSYVPETSPGAGDAKIVWNAGDLPGVAGFVYSQYVTFSVHLTGKVRAEQEVGFGNDYSVASMPPSPQPSQPPVGTTGFLSNAPNVSCHVNGSISFTLTKAPSSPAAPGGLITYVFTLANRSSAAVTNPVADVVVPDNTRWAPTYPSGLSGALFVGTSAAAFKAKLVYWTHSTNPQVVMAFPALAAHATAQVSVTFQVQWADPTVVTAISSIDYGAAFLDASQPKPVSGASQFTTLFNAIGVVPKTSTFTFPPIAAGSSPASAVTTDFFSLISDPSGKLARSLNQSGAVTTTLQGSLDAQPKVDVYKKLNNTLAKTEDDGLGDGGRVDLAKPGDQLTFTLILQNGGASP